MLPGGEVRVIKWIQVDKLFMGSGKRKILKFFRGLNIEWRGSQMWKSWIQDVIFEIIWLRQKAENLQWITDCIVMVSGGGGSGNIWSNICKIRINKKWKFCYVYENNWTLMPACRVNRFFLSDESEINIVQTDFFSLFCLF